MCQRCDKSSFNKDSDCNGLKHRDSDSMHQFTMTLKTHDCIDHLWLVLGDRLTGKLTGNAIKGK